MVQKLCKIALPPVLAPFVAAVSHTEIPGCALKASWRELKQEGLVQLMLEGTLAEACPVGSFEVLLTPAFRPDFHWAPHLTPEQDSVVDMHVFRTPALIACGANRMLAVLPDVEALRQPNGNRVFLDLNAQTETYAVGLTTTAVRGHVLYRRTDGATLPAGPFRFSVLLLGSDNPESVENPFRPVLRYYWAQYGQRQSAQLAPLETLPQYVKRTYDWAFGNWRDRVWQEFDDHGTRVGAPQMIVTVFQSRHYGKPYSIREHVAIWNQAWFCSLRSAMGVFRYARLHQDDALLVCALKTKELALHFPQQDGLFDSVVACPDQRVEIDGQFWRRAGSWEDRYYGNSDRNPLHASIEAAPRHILDMSWTAKYMVRWYRELEQDERLLAYAIRYADRLVALQDEAGYYPAWLKDGKPLPELRQSPESAASATFLLELYAVTGNPRYRSSALKAVDALVRDVLPTGRWEDFETYWSCSHYGEDTLLGRKCARNDMYKQCTLSIFYLAEALLACFGATKQQKYLQRGVRCLDELLMAQSSFQPEAMPLAVVGGFGVMNCDAELNDARQSLFAETIIRYGRLLGNDEYVQRGYAALRASFSMMYCPENPGALREWQKKWPFLGEDDYGFMMENYGHQGYADDLSSGIGEFTIYDWGNGAAAEAVMRIFELDRQ